MVIVGAGFGGIGLAVRLRDEGIDDVVVLEREDDVGGTWYVNTYPGCQCDVPSLLYSLSSAPNPEWTRTFAPQPEIEEYLRAVAERTDVRRRIRFGTEVTGARWEAGGQPVARGDLGRHRHRGPAGAGLRVPQHPVHPRPSTVWTGSVARCSTRPAGTTTTT